MKLSFRWYGADDPVSLEYISQIPGMRSVVSAVYDVKPGGVWSRESLAAIAEACRTHGLVFDVVESIPVHEDIKLGRPDADSLIDNYCENIRRCAEVGVKCVTYNFMPVFDWTRSELDRRAADGSTSLVLYTDSLRGLDPLHEDIHLPGMPAIRRMRCAGLSPHIPSLARRDSGTALSIFFAALSRSPRRRA